MKKLLFTLGLLLSLTSSSDADLLAKYFTPKGGEYEDYLRSPLSRK